MINLLGWFHQTIDLLVTVCAWYVSSSCLFLLSRALQTEYDQLLLTHRDPSVRPDSSQKNNNNGVACVGDVDDAELLAEAKQLAKHKTQLEVRMRILEDHNRQLEAQLQRLHLLLDQVAV